MCCRCVETDAEVRRCLSALGKVVDVVPDTRKCRRSSDVLVTSHKHRVESVQDASVSRSQTTESAENVTLTRSRSFSSQPDIANVDIRDYLIDRCVTDTNRATVSAAAADDDDNDNDDYDEIDGDDKTDKGLSSVVLDVLRDSNGERSSNPPLVLPSQRFSDSELVKRSYPPAGSATFPGRATFTAGAADPRVKRHKWKLLSKALNLFSLDETTAADAARTVCIDDDVDGNASDGGDGGQSDGGAGQSGDDQSQGLDVRSTSVESLPGLVPAPRQTSRNDHHCHHHHQHHVIIYLTRCN